MHEMEREMSEAIAKYTPFSAGDIYSAWLSFKSFDLILRAVEFAGVFGIASVSEAMNHLVTDYIREQRSGLTKRETDGVCPNCGNKGRIIRYGIEQCDECGYPTPRLTRAVMRDRNRR